jgi:hypothetical protein
MTPQPIEVLSSADMALLNRTLQGCVNMECVIEKLKSIGYDVSDMEAEVARQKKVASGLKAAFFPDHP